MRNIQLGLGACVPNDGFVQLIPFNKAVFFTNKNLFKNSRLKILTVRLAD